MQLIQLILKLQTVSVNIKFLIDFLIPRALTKKFYWL